MTDPEINSAFGAISQDLNHLYTRTWNTKLVVLGLVVWLVALTVYVLVRTGTS